MNDISDPCNKYIYFIAGYESTASYVTPSTKFTDNNSINHIWFEISYSQYETPNDDGDRTSSRLSYTNIKPTPIVGPPIQNSASRHPTNNS